MIGQNFFRCVAYTALLLGSCAVPTAAQEPVTLTLGGAARLAAKQSGRAEAARFRAAMAESRVRQQRADLLPSFSAVVDVGERTFNSAGFGITFRDPVTGSEMLPPDGAVFGPVRTWNLRGVVRQSIIDLGALARLRAARATASVGATEAVAISQEAAVTAARLYVRAARADALVAAREADSILADEVLESARGRRAAGLGILLDETRAQTQLAAARAQLIVTRAERDRSRLELRRALGLSLDAPLTLGDSLHGLPTGGVPGGEVEALGRTPRSRADLQAVEAQVRAARQEISAIRWERLPALSVFAERSRTGIRTDRLLGTYSWGLQLSIPVFDGLRRKGRIAEQRLAVLELEVLQRELSQQVALEVRQAALDLESAREQVSASAARLSFAEQEVAQARTRFATGMASNSEVITALVGLNAARTQMVDARAGLQAARVSMARARGTVTGLR